MSPLTPLVKPVPPVPSPIRLCPWLVKVADHVRAGAAELDQVQGDDRVPDAERPARAVEDAAAGGRAMFSTMVQLSRVAPCVARCRRRRRRRSCR